MSESVDPILGDPWKTPPIEVDPALIEVSERLMVKTLPIENSEFAEANPPLDELEEKDPRIAQLEAQRQQLFDRNVTLTIEAARLRAANQRLMDQIAELKQAAKSRKNWFWRLIGQQEKASS